MHVSVLTGTGTKHRQSTSCSTRYFTAYPYVDISLLKIYATDEIIIETESDIMGFVQLSHIMPSQYAEMLVTKHFRVETLMKNML